MEIIGFKRHGEGQQLEVGQGSLVLQGGERGAGAAQRDGFVRVGQKSPARSGSGNPEKKFGRQPESQGWPSQPRSGWDKSDTRATRRPGRPKTAVFRPPGGDGRAVSSTTWHDTIRPPVSGASRAQPRPAQRLTSPLCAKMPGYRSYRWPQRWVGVSAVSSAVLPVCRFRCQVGVSRSSSTSVPRVNDLTRSGRRPQPTP